MAWVQDGHDFVPVVEMLNLADVRFILPHAPYQKITLNNGYEMRAWYDLYGLNAHDKQDAAGIAVSQAFISQLIARENQRGIASHRIVISRLFTRWSHCLIYSGAPRTSTGGRSGAIDLFAFKSEFSGRKTTCKSTYPYFHGTWGQ